MQKRRKKMLTLLAVILGLVAVLALGGVAFLHSARFGRLPSGARLERIRKSPNYRDGQFQNLHETQMMTSDKGRLRTMWDFLFGDKQGLRPDHPVPAVRTDLRRLPGGNRFVWFGHSSYLLRLDGKTVLVDPVLRAGAPFAFLNKPFKGADLYKPEDMPAVDYLIISHDHWDHLDYETVVELRDRIGKVICPLGVGEHFERWGFRPEQLVELDWQESATLAPSFAVRCLPARHFSGRGLTANQSLWASFLLDTPTMRTFIGGDSGYDTHFAEIGKQYPDIDLAILENGQYNEDWKYIHLLPKFLGRAARDLGARACLTVHHSKFALARHRWDEPLENERRAARDYHLPLIVTQIGEPVSLDSLAHRR